MEGIVKPLLNLLIKPRVALAALASAATVVAVSALTAGPALARAVSAVAVPGHGLPSPAQGAGGGNISLVGAAVVAALVAGSVAFGLIGWHYDRRRVARSTIAGHEVAATVATDAAQPASEPLTSNGPAAAKPLSTHGAVASRARRQEGELTAAAGDRDHEPMI
jgi:hypothetical protein